MEKIRHTKHMSATTANGVFKVTVFRYLRQKVDVPEHSLGQFPVNEAMWRMFMNTLMWAAVRLDKDGDQSRRVLRNMDVESIQKLTTQRAIRSRVFKKENCYVNWIGPKAHGSRVLRLIKEFRTTTGKSFCLRGFRSMSWRKMPTPSPSRKKSGTRETFIFRHISGISKSL